MRTSFLIILGLTILVVALAAKPKKNERSVDKSSPKSKSPPAKKPSKKAAEEEDDDIPEDLDDILQDDEDDEDEVEIPTEDELTTESDPIELGQRIKSLADRKKRRELVKELKKAWNKNKGTFPGKFYQAAYASLSKAKGAEALARKFWDRELEKAIQKATNPGKDIVGRTKSGLGDVLGKAGLGGILDQAGLGGVLGQAGLGDAIGNARKIAQISPVGIALRRGESVLLSSLSDTFKNVGKVTDFAHDATINTSKLIRAATFPVDSIPILSDIKNNVHDYIEETAKRGKFLTGSFADNSSTAFANASRDADKKAEVKEDLLRQFSSSRRLD